MHRIAPFVWNFAVYKVVSHLLLQVLCQGGRAVMIAPLRRELNITRHADIQATKGWWLDWG